MPKLRDRIGEGFDAVETNIDNKTVPQKNPQEFLTEWITERLPEAIVTIATKVAGRDDGSGLLAKTALDAGLDDNFAGGMIKRATEGKI